MDRMLQEKEDLGIRMAGIDHTLAGVQIREQYAFTRKSARKAMERICEEPGVEGCVILSTCNRMEVYVSCTKEGEPIDLCSLLCRICPLEREMYHKYFVERRGREAVSHLFFLTAGLESKILGEDQILTQVGEALGLAREAYAADSVLEVLFRQAVTAGKKIKTDIPMDKENESAPALAIERLCHMGYDIAGKTCMVIGNGVMGKLTALALKEAGADVTVTVREYKSGVVEIPRGCKRVNYGERYQYLPCCDFVFSATASPNITITKEQVMRAGFQKPLFFIDLAVPRDIDPAVAELDQVSLFDIDDFSIDRCSQRMKRQYEKAVELLGQGVLEYENWYLCRDYLPLIGKIGSGAAKDVGWRMGQALSAVTKEREQQEILRKAAEDSSEKVFRHMLFALRDKLSPEELCKILHVLEEEYGQ